MADIKLFRVAPSGASELAAQSMQIEKSLQALFEANLEALIGVRFLASEYTTGPVHGGRIDTLGIDENGSPVIIEYKRTVVESVINQGLFYLDWLMDHRKEFQWLVLEQLGAEVANGVDWTAPRLVCIAGDFTRYDGHAVKQINRSIELLRYRRFGDDLLMIEQVHTPKISKSSVAVALPVSSPQSSPVGTPAKDPYLSQRIGYRIANSSPELRDLYEAVSAYLVALGDDVEQRETKFYMAFKRIKNFVCAEVYPQAKVVTCFLKIDPDTVDLEAGFTRDVRQIGHFGTGDLEVAIRNARDFLKAQPLFQRAYDGG
jgi:predicted transport protein